MSDIPIAGAYSSTGDSINDHGDVAVVASLPPPHYRSAVFVPADPVQSSVVIPNGGTNAQHLQVNGARQVVGLDGGIGPSTPFFGR